MNALTPNTEVPSRFETFSDQKRPVRILSTFLDTDTIPHALLFTGIDGVGKKQIATAFAMAVNCVDRNTTQRDAAQTRPHALHPCGVCRSCRKVEKNLHPDILTVQPDGRSIRIHQIRTLIETLSLKPMEAQRRFVIIEQADTMNPAAANALLKTLEEPPERTILILLAGQATDLLPTTVSRCRHIRFHPLKTVSIAERLIQNHSVSNTDAWLIASAANGSFTRALAIKESDWKTWRNWLLTASGLDRLDGLPQKPVGELLAFAEQLMKQKRRVTEALEAMTAWLRDLIVIRHDMDKAVNVDRKDELRTLSQRLPVQILINKMGVIRQAHRSIESNSNMRLTLEAMVLRLAQDCGKKDVLSPTSN